MARSCIVVGYHGEGGRAAGARGRAISLYEYQSGCGPVGPRFWRQRAWPATIRTVFGLKTLREFSCAIDIGEAIELKRKALDCHASQMTRYVPETDWMTLADVADGEFLENFFQSREVFKPSPVVGRSLRAGKRPGLAPHTS